MCSLLGWEARQRKKSQRTMSFTLSRVSLFNRLYKIYSLKCPSIPVLILQNRTKNDVINENPDNAVTALDRFH